MAHIRNSAFSKTLAFHHIDKRFTWGVTNYSPRRFRRLVKHLADLRREFQIAPKLTFDDGYLSLLLYAAPVLREYGFIAKVFVPTAFVGCENEWDYSHALSPTFHLSSTQIEDLADEGVEFQSHGHTHVDLTALSAEALRLELVKSKALLEKTLGREVSEIAYPYGRYNSSVEDVARAVGYRRAWSMRPTDYGPFTYGRWGVYSFDTPLTVTAKLTGSPLTQRVELFKSKVVSRVGRLGAISLWAER